MKQRFLYAKDITLNYLFIYYCTYKNIMLLIFQFLIFLYIIIIILKNLLKKKTYMELFLYVIANLNGN